MCTELYGRLEMGSAERMRRLAKELAFIAADSTLHSLHVYSSWLWQLGCAVQFMAANAMLTCCGARANASTSIPVRCKLVRDRVVQSPAGVAELAPSALPADV